MGKSGASNTDKNKAVCPVRGSGKTRPGGVGMAERLVHTACATAAVYHGQHRTLIHHSVSTCRNSCAVCLSSEDGVTKRNKLTLFHKKLPDAEEPEKGPSLSSHCVHKTVSRDDSKQEHFPCLWSLPQTEKHARCENSIKTSEHACSRAALTLT